MMSYYNGVALLVLLYDANSCINGVILRLSAKEGSFFVLAFLIYVILKIRIWFRITNFFCG